MSLEKGQSINLHQINASTRYSKDGAANNDALNSRRSSSDGCGDQEEDPVTQHEPLDVDKLHDLVQKRAGRCVS